MMSLADFPTRKAPMAWTASQSPMPRSQRKRRASSPAVLISSVPYVVLSQPTVVAPLTPEIGPTALSVLLQDSAEDVQVGATLWSEAEAALELWDSKQALFLPIGAIALDNHGGVESVEVAGQGTRNSGLGVEGLEDKNISDLPREILLKVMSFVEDTDLQTLAHVSRLFRILSTDPVLWIRYILFTRNPYRLRYHLSLPQRPTREQLVEANILKCGITAVRDGHYVNGPQAASQFEARRKVWRQLVEKSLGRRLAKRPKMEELRERNVLPSEALVPTEVPAASHRQLFGKVQRSATMPELLVENEKLSDGPSESVVFPGAESFAAEPTAEPLLSPSPPPKICSTPLLPKVVQLSKALTKDRLKRRMEGGRRILDDLRDGENFLSPDLRKATSKPATNDNKESSPTIEVSYRVHGAKPNHEYCYPFFYLNIKQYRSKVTRSTLAESIRSSVGFFEDQARRWAPPAPPLPAELPARKLRV